MPACWPTVVERSAGVTRIAMRQTPGDGRVPDDRPPASIAGCRIAPDLPRYPLLDGAQPARCPPRISPTPSAADVELWLKREDLLALGLGGNKLRNLEFLVGEALAAGADVLVTTGRRWSNHARLTAAAGARAGLERPPRPVRPAGRAARARTRDLDAPARARPSIRRRPPSARRDEALRGRGRRRTARGWTAAISSSPSAGRRRVGRAGQVLAGLELVAQLARSAGRADARHPAVGDRWHAGRAPRGGCVRPVAGDAGRRRGGRAAGRSELRPVIAAIRRRAGRVLGSTPSVPPTIVLDAAPARRGLRPPDSGRGRGRRAPRPHRGGPRRPDLHRQGARRARRHRPGGCARRADGASSGTPAGRPACSSRWTGGG